MLHRKGQKKGTDLSLLGQEPTFNVSYVTVMMTITSEDYEEHYWPKLEQAINQLLTLSPGQYIPISYEQMYRYSTVNHLKFVRDL